MCHAEWMACLPQALMDERLSSVYHLSGGLFQWFKVTHLQFAASDMLIWAKRGRGKGIRTRPCALLCHDGLGGMARCMGGHGCFLLTCMRMGLYMLTAVTWLPADRMDSRLLASTTLPMLAARQTLLRSPHLSESSELVYFLPAWTSSHREVALCVSCLAPHGM